MCAPSVSELGVERIDSKGSVTVYISSLSSHERDFSRPEISSQKFYLYINSY